MSKWPKKVKHRNKVLAKIYRPCQGRDSYRLTWYAAGKRQMKSFSTYAGPGGAKEYGEALVKELARNSQVAMLTPPQATDALAALERLNTFHQSTGKRVSLLAAVSEFAEASTKLRGQSLAEAAEGYLRTVARVKRRDLKEAVDEFRHGRQPLTRSTNGERAQLSSKYAYNLEIQLRRFAGTFPDTAVCDLTRDLVDAYFRALGEFSAKTRNHHRNTLRAFLAWAVRKDYLPVAHRLNEADGMRPEHANTAEVQFYTPREFRALLGAADGPMRAIIAIGGLAGLRTQELLRLDWADVWRVKGHLEISAAKAKTRQRRLVKICPALAAWLQPFREFKTGPLWARLSESVFIKTSRDLWGKAGVLRKPNGLRHSFCSYGYVLHGENWTAQQAGHAPAMVHAAYKGLAVKKEAAAWFAVKPPKTALKGDAAG